MGARPLSAPLSPPLVGPKPLNQTLHKYPTLKIGMNPTHPTWSPNHKYAYSETNYHVVVKVD